MIIAPVLRRSAEFDERHVYWFGRQVAAHYPEATYLPFSDTDLAIPHVRIDTTLPKWWAKMEITKHETDEPMLIIDLDTVLLRHVEIPTDRPYILRHFTHKDKVAGGMVLWTPDFRQRLNRHFFADPRRHMVDANGDDQRYYSRHFGDELGRFQDVLPDEIVSYKFTVQHWGVHPRHAFVFYHGAPRPWTPGAELPQAVKFHDKN